MVRAAPGIRNPWLNLKSRLSSSLRPFLRILAYGALAALLVAPFALPYLRVRGGLGLERSLAEALTAAPALTDYLTPPPGHPLRLLLGPALGEGGGLFLGIIPLALALIGVATTHVPGTFRKCLARGYWLLLAAAAILLSLGPRLKVGANDPGGLALPFAWLYEHVPGMTVIRAPGRFAVAAYLALALLAAWGATWLLARVRRPALRGMFSGLLIALLAWPNTRRASSPSRCNRCPAWPHPRPSTRGWRSSRAP